MSLEEYNELLKAMCENTDNSQINSIIYRHAILRGISSNSAPLKPHEQSLNEAAIAICSKIPQLLFYRKELKCFALQVRYVI